MAAPVPAPPGDPPKRRQAELIAVSVGTLVFAVLLIAVRLRWGPLEAADHDAAARLNSLVAGHPALVAVIKAVTWLGSDGALWTVLGGSAAVMAARRRWKLASYLLVTGAGALVLDPVLKSLVGRLRPVVAHPVAHGTGNSFPSGHSLGSIVCYGAVLLVFLPATRPGWPRATLRYGIGLLIAAIGISRILLGVHYLSDVAGAWALGLSWLGLTALAFDPLHTGTPGGRPPDTPRHPETTMARPARQYARIAAGVLTAWVLILGVVVGFGELVVKYSHDTWLGDTAIPRWFAAHRTPAGNHWSDLISVACATTGILVVAVAACLLFLLFIRHWRPVVFVGVVMIGEVTAFLASAAVVKRPRPYVHHLDHHLPTSAYPSGHMAATCCLYIAIAIVVIGHARGWWRWLLLIPAIVMPVLIALSRMYRGEHHPTDIAGSIIFAALWLTATTLLIKPNAVHGRPAPQAGRARNRTFTGRVVSLLPARAAAEK
ncbi:MAG TPA: phosphatase PAP2 family protein [Streptosporangiaceae bacterium]